MRTDNPVKRRELHVSSSKTLETAEEMNQIKGKFLGSVYSSTDLCCVQLMKNSDINYYP